MYNASMPTIYINEYDPTRVGDIDEPSIHFQQPDGTAKSMRETKEAYTESLDLREARPGDLFKVDFYEFPNGDTFGPIFIEISDKTEGENSIPVKVYGTGANGEQISYDTAYFHGSILGYGGSMHTGKAIPQMHLEIAVYDPQLAEEQENGASPLYIYIPSLGIHYPIDKAILRSECKKLGDLEAAESFIKEHIGHRVIVTSKVASYEKQAGNRLLNADVKQPE